MEQLQKIEVRHTVDGVALTGRALEIAEHVYNRNQVWDAYDQGRLAHALGQPYTSNPWRHPALPWHVNWTDWERGWTAEDERPFAGDPAHKYMPVLDGPAEIERCEHCGRGLNAHNADRRCPQPEPDAQEN